MDFDFNSQNIILHILLSKSLWFYLHITVKYTYFLCLAIPFKSFIILISVQVMVSFITFLLNNREQFRSLFFQQQKQQTFIQVGFSIGKQQQQELKLIVYPQNRQFCAYSIKFYHIQDQDVTKENSRIKRWKLIQKPSKEYYILMMIQIIPIIS
ncbi:unnamed protein product (macronuclear) [Paramecium tetraurelia]|uniref:Transmembrane protein n=1 Tax=Paramecium tetraurelia TaxID=5888 RepID=A0DA03_PARTE|nr:uncharacterized protein GSPATT00014802001 [Paramecium tetraurelia]CAK79870.1 unnamed protein product [Paramecium tetraurelia]|eukprot:XP_001447267.1 hypothetical protein (macronuclear) [Paramecium tetraurelia strain d4-2]